MAYKYFFFQNIIVDYDIQILTVGYNSLQILINNVNARDPIYNSKNY